jgi:hypothetical protein
MFPAFPSGISKMFSEPRKQKLPAPPMAEITENGKTTDVVFAIYTQVTGQVSGEGPEERPGAERNAAG